MIPLIPVFSADQTVVFPSHFRVAGVNVGSTWTIAFGESVPFEAILTSPVGITINARYYFYNSGSGDVAWSTEDGYVFTSPIGGGPEFTPPAPGVYLMFAKYKRVSTGVFDMVSTTSTLTVT